VMAIVLVFLIISIGCCPIVLFSACCLIKLFPAGNFLQTLLKRRKRWAHTIEIWFYYVVVQHKGCTDKNQNTDDSQPEAEHRAAMHFSQELIILRQEALVFQYQLL